MIFFYCGKNSIKNEKENSNFGFFNDLQSFPPNDENGNPGKVAPAKHELMGHEHRQGDD